MQGLSLLWLSKTQNPREPLEFYKAHLGSECASIAPNLLKNLSRGCTGEAASASCTVAWSLGGLCCSALAATNVLHPFLCKHLTSEISCSWVTSNGSFTFLVHFTAWGSTHRHLNQGRSKEGIPLSSSLSTDREHLPAHTCAAPGSQPALPHPPFLLSVSPPRPQVPGRITALFRSPWASASFP